MREDEVSLLVPAAHCARGRREPVGGPGLAALERLQIGVGQNVEEDALPLLLERGLEHLQEDRKLFRVARLVRDLFDICRADSIHRSPRFCTF